MAGTYEKRPIIEVDAPYGFCHCGCGEKAPLSPVNHRGKGLVKGEPYRFIKNHAKLAPEPPLPRFNASYEVKANGCWEWTGSVASHGYGSLGVNGRTETAPRMAYKLFVGKIPEGACVLHSCDNRLCVNPSHLTIGDKAQNAAEAVERGRFKTLRGEQNPKAKLTEAEVSEIRSLFDEGWGRKDVGDAYAVSEGAVYGIGDRRTWEHVEEVAA